MAYLDVAAFRLRTLMPSGDVDALESIEPGWLEQTLADVSDEIDTRLRKRYEAPFSAPYPRAVLRWLAAIVTLEAFLKRGFNPRAEQDQLVEKRALKAEADIKEAADAKDGLFDLPLRANTTATGIAKGGPLSYSESSPYEWTDTQAERMRQ